MKKNTFLKTKEGKMKNKTMRYFLLAGMFLFFAGTGGAWAESCAVPTSCTTGSGWTIELLGVTQQPAEVCESSWEGMIECYLWEYSSQLVWKYIRAYPTASHNSYHCGGEEPLFAAQDLYPPGVGDPTSKLGLDILTYLSQDLNLIIQVDFLLL